MSNKPKKQDYKPSEAEKTQASVAKAEKDYFDQRYGPLLREMRDLAATEDFAPTAKGRAQADTMQALTSSPSLRAAQSVDANPVSFLVRLSMTAPPLVCVSTQL